MRAEIKSGLGEVKASESEVNQEKTEAGAEHCDPAPRVTATHLLPMLHVERRDDARGGNAATE
jgi:hypothetical protein